MPLEPESELCSECDGPLGDELDDGICERCWDRWECLYLDPPEPRQVCTGCGGSLGGENDDGICGKCLQKGRALLEDSDDFGGPFPLSVEYDDV